MLKQVILDNVRVLTFQSPSAAIRTHWPSYLAFGLLMTWLAGIGRYWDNPRAELWQYLGLGSVAYVLLLACLLWAVIYPLRPPRWSFRSMLIFLTLCSPPALLYAIPVERFMSLSAAQSANAWFLAVVASWRVALLALFLRRGAGLSFGASVVGCLLPIVLIIVALSALNLEHVVFSLMSGIAPEQRSSADLSYGIVVMLSALSLLAAPFLLFAYAVLAYLAFRQRRTSG
ncbi:hypothetical protein [Pseudomarimonas arenosa]|uniref:Uncharacterized protein n=1 Tax=Pseudomarimonas arenosa TaxID=2774145 RepID=A0AAW3ZH87_9GAMM|nr:hypothetical protein [Pseudomarimonas arenosa]MBD8524320.1 hypothetical protein [Pseudomarimonas arenosa]